MEFNSLTIYEKDYQGMSYGLKEIEICLKEVYIEKAYIDSEMKRATNVLLDGLEYVFLAPINAGIYKGYTFEISLHGGHYYSIKHKPEKPLKAFDETWKPF